MEARIVGAMRHASQRLAQVSRQEVVERKPHSQITPRQRGEIIFSRHHGAQQIGLPQLQRAKGLQQLRRAGLGDQQKAAQLALGLVFIPQYLALGKKRARPYSASG